MDAKTYLAALPAARKVWRWLPGPVRVAAVALVVAIAVARLLGDDEEEPAAEATDS